jgi:hypothetical protein
MSTVKWTIWNDDGFGIDNWSARVHERERAVEGGEEDNQTVASLKELFDSLENKKWAVEFDMDILLDQRRPVINCFYEALGMRGIF